MKYAQCLLRKQDTSGLLIKTVAWIPEKYAKIPTRLRLREDGEKQWSDGWTVEVVWTLIDEDRLLERSRDFKRFLEVLEG